MSTESSRAALEENKSYEAMEHVLNCLMERPRAKHEYGDRFPESSTGTMVTWLGRAGIVYATGARIETPRGGTSDQMALTPMGRWLVGESALHSAAVYGMLMADKKRLGDALKDAREKAEREIYGDLPSRVRALLEYF